MYSKRGRFLPIESGPRIILPYVVFRAFVFRFQGMVSPSPIRRQSSGYHSTSPPITQAARGTQTHPLSNLRTPICLPQPDFFLFPSSRSGDGKLSYPSHANFQISQSTTLSHPPLFVSIHAMPAIPLLGFCFCGGKISLTVRCQYVPMRDSRKLVSVIRGKQ